MEGRRAPQWLYRSTIVGQCPVKVYSPNGGTDGTVGATGLTSIHPNTPDDTFIRRGLSLKSFKSSVGV